MVFWLCKNMFSIGEIVYIKLPWQPGRPLEDLTRADLMLRAIVLISTLSNCIAATISEACPPFL